MTQQQIASKILNHIQKELYAFQFNVKICENASVIA